MTREFFPMDTPHGLVGCGRRRLCDLSTLIGTPLVRLMATWHTSQEPWPWHCESPKESSVRITVPTHLQNHVVWSRTLKCSVKAYVTGPSTKCNVVSMILCSCRSSHMIKYNKSMVESVRSAMEDIHAN